MKTVTLDVRDPADAVGGFVRVWKAGKPGVVDRAAGGGVVLPYEAVKVEFVLRAAS